MHGELIQFNSGDHVLGNKNVTEAVITDGDIVFNESYVVIGESLEAKNIHATYDLDVVANIAAVTIIVNGNLFVKGDIEADEVICSGSFYCTGEARVKKCNFGSNALIGSVIGKEVYAAGDLFIKATIDTDESLEADGLVVAGEGIMGNGLFKAKAAIANEYFEFSGRNKSKVFEISEMQFTESSDTEDIDNQHVEPDALDIESAVEVFNKVLNKSIDEWNQFEEEKFIIEVRKVAESMYDLQMIDRVVDTVIALSYERQIENFKDYLFVLCAKNTFPERMAKYETLQPVLEDMLNAATYRMADWVPLLENHDLSYEIEIPETEYMTRVDSTAYTRILNNLLQNILTHSDASKVFLTVTETEQQAKIVVADNGNGIAASDLPHIFERMYQCDHSRSAKGNGLGLSIAKELVSIHKGTITAASVPGNGTTFIIILPKAL